MHQPNENDRHPRITKRVIGGLGGLAIAIAGIWLGNAFPDHPMAVQVTVWTVLIVAMMASINYRQRRERWFWWAMLAASLAHVLFVITLRRQLPFSDLGVAILIGFPEAILLQALVVAIARFFPTDMASH
ncbi:MAG: hypothetical protein WBW69_03160 [Candidatus Korobacteraceae bacterium]